MSWFSSTKTSDDTLENLQKLITSLKLDKKPTSQLYNIVQLDKKCIFVQNNNLPASEVIESMTPGEIFKFFSRVMKPIVEREHCFHGSCKRTPVEANQLIAIWDEYCKFSYEIENGKNIDLSMTKPIDKFMKHNSASLIKSNPLASTIKKMFELLVENLTPPTVQKTHVEKVLSEKSLLDTNIEFSDVDSNSKSPKSDSSVSLSGVENFEKLSSKKETISK